VNLIGNALEGDVFVLSNVIWRSREGLGDIHPKAIQRYPVTLIAKLNVPYCCNSNLHRFRRVFGIGLAEHSQMVFEKLDGGPGSEGLIIASDIDYLLEFSSATDVRRIGRLNSPMTPHELEILKN
jgi:hypothetical protein